MKKFWLILLVIGCFGIPFAQAGTSPRNAVQSVINASQNANWQAVTQQIIGGEEAQITTDEERQFTELFMAVLATAKITNVETEGNQALVYVEYTNPETGETETEEFSVVCIDGEWKINFDEE